MFEALDDGGLLETMRRSQRDERMAIARRIVAAGRLCQRRMAAVDAADRAQWCIDNWEAVAAEVAAELGISRGRASSQMDYGVQLLERLPRLGRLFASGAIDFRIVIVAVFRTGLITDPGILAAVDEELADRAAGWNTFSRKRITEIVDWTVRGLDPHAVRNTRDADDDRHVAGAPGRDVTNHLPKVSGDDPAVWRRLRVVPCDVVIPPEDRDPHLDERLQTEADAVLAWAIAGWATYRDNGDSLAEPPQVLAATGKYQQDSDAVARFLDEECVTTSLRVVVATSAHVRGSSTPRGGGVPRRPRRRTS